MRKDREVPGGYVILGLNWSERFGWNQPTLKAHCDTAVEAVRLTREWNRQAAADHKYIWIEAQYAPDTRRDDTA